MRELSDIEVISRFGSNRNEALEELYNRYATLVYGVCLKYLGSRDDSLDAVTDIFTFIGEKILIHEISNFKSWLYSVAKNHCLMKLRKDKRVTNALTDYFEDPESGYLDTSDEEMTTELIEMAITQLSPEQKMCVELFYYDKKSYSEITEITGFDYKSVKSYLQNGKIKLKKILEEQK
ncbi:MAG: sigma-70 family RNA polymerase sigma factor [Bacteroidales bacterium]|nr:sigma-70 family RNA polymerase sigma factor [Bacteroidales bacterium]